MYLYTISVTVKFKKLLLQVSWFYNIIIEKHFFILHFFLVSLNFLYVDSTKLITLLPEVQYIQHAIQNNGYTHDY